MIVEPAADGARAGVAPKARQARRLEIRLAGTGGQGQILAAIILADAAALYDGFNVVQTQDYGPESRGGASKAEVIITDGEVDYPKVTRPDALLAMSQQAFTRYAPAVREDGLILADTTWVKDASAAPTGVRLVGIPLTAIARDEVGKALVANVVALGALAALTGAVSREALERAVLARVPKGTEELNRRALEAGYLAAGAARESGGERRDAARL